MSTKLTRTAILLLYLLLLLLSIAAIVTTALVLPSKAYRGNTGAEVWTGETYSDFWQVWYIAPGTTYASIYAILAAGIINIPCAFAGALSYVSSSWKAPYFGVGASAASFIVAVIAFVWSFVATYTSDRAYHGPFPAPTNGRGFYPVGNGGSFSVESYTCQTIDLHAPDHRLTTRRTCLKAESARWLTLPLLITSITLLAIWVIKFVKPRQQKREADGVKLSSMSGHN